MAEGKDVVLHVYELKPENGQETSSSFWYRMLPSIGMGAYHTKIEMDGYHYTYVANQGIVKTLSRYQGVPSNAKFKESIVLGTCSLRGEVNSIIRELRKTFKPNGYHMVHRNCNSFTETFATAIILYDQLVEDIKLETYPQWVNRLANTGKMVIPHDSDIVPCNVLEEARNAVGVR